jgi:peptidoglycan/xylan/chitin deacetylase (PgdA/CDA1 family)
MILSRRDFLKLSGAALLAATFGRATEAPAASLPPIIYRGSARYPRIALTYDDGYLVTRLRDMLALLDQFPDFRITLFPVGVALLNNESKDKGIWKRYFEGGHEFGYHSWDHTNLAVFDPKEVVEDYDKWYEALSKVLGTSPFVRFARPPFGVLSYPFEFMCGERGLTAAMWSTGWGGGYEKASSDIAKVQNGEIVLMHFRTDDYETSKMAFAILKERGIQPVTMSTLYNDWLREKNQSVGCDASAAPSLTRTCIE